MLQGLDPAYRALSRQRHQLADTHTRVLKRVEPGEVAQVNLAGPQLGQPHVKPVAQQSWGQTLS